jgi:hypothetical protein
VKDVQRSFEETQRENVHLSEVEAKMLYFSETAWKLPRRDFVKLLATRP